MVATLPRPRRTWSIRTAFWLVIATQALLLGASNFPTPLFPLYERRYGFSSGVVTMLFAVYALALVPSLLTFGRLADRVGRRPVLVTGIALTSVSSLAFAFAQGTAWLFAGEILYGIAGGLVMSCVPVTIRELHPKGSVAGGALAATLAASAGLTLGPLTSGVLATITPWPTVAPYVLDIVLALVLAAALLRIPETRPEPAPTLEPAHRAPVLNVPRSIRPAFAAATLASAGAWMTTGWVFGLSPSFLHEELGVHVTQPVVSGLFAALMVGTNGATQVAFRRHDSARTLRTALVVMVAGLGAIVASTLAVGLAVAVVGAVLAGAGAGVIQMHTMGTIQRIAPVHARSGVSSAFLTACYLALSLPVVIAGLSADRIGLGRVSGDFLLGLLVLVGAALVAGRRLERDGMVDDDVLAITPILDVDLDLDVRLEVA